ncbi:hypothetical protein TeGR_g8696, partial [Tetraparma gracilis]
EGDDEFYAFGDPEKSVPSYQDYYLFDILNSEWLLTGENDTAIIAEVGPFVLQDWSQYIDMEVLDCPDETGKCLEYNWIGAHIFLDEDVTVTASGLTGSSATYDFESRAPANVNRFMSIDQFSVGYLGALGLGGNEFALFLTANGCSIAQIMNIGAVGVDPNMFTCTGEEEDPDSCACCVLDDVARAMDYGGAKQGGADICKGLDAEVFAGAMDACNTGGISMVKDQVKAGVDYEILKGGVQMGVATATATAIGAGWADMTEDDQNAAVASALADAITAAGDEDTFYAGAIAAGVGDADAQAAAVAAYVAGEAATAGITAAEWYEVAIAGAVATQAGDASDEAAAAWYLAAATGGVEAAAAAAGVSAYEYCLPGLVDGGTMLALEGMIAADPLGGDWGPTFIAGIDANVQAGIDAMIRDGVDAMIRDGVDTAVRAGVDAAVRAGVDAMIRDGIDAMIRDGVDTAVRAGVDAAVRAGGQADAAGITVEDWYTASIAAGAQGQADAASITVEEWYTASIAVGAQGQADAAGITVEEWYTASIAVGAQGQADAASTTVEEWYTASIAVGAQGEADTAGITVEEWYTASIAGYAAGEAATAGITVEEWYTASIATGAQGQADAASITVEEWYTASIA